MDEMSSLQAALAQAALAETAHRISERNAVDIMIKLMETKAIQLIFTKSGREFVTPAQLVDDLERELVSAGGRVTLADVAPLLGVDLHHLQTAARALVAKKGRKLTELAGELIAEEYLDGIVEEINESLHESGSIGLLELAQRFSLPVDFMRATIEQRLSGEGGGLTGFIEDNLLYTARFLQLHTARVRGIMRAVVRPTPLKALIQRHGLMESRVARDVAALLKEGVIAGSLKGAEDRAIFTPDIFLRGQNTGVESFFSTNGYIPYSTVERLSIPNPRAFLATKYPQALQLSSVVIADSLVASVNMAAEDALNSHLFMNAQTILPNVLSKSEVEQVLKHAVATANQAVTPAAVAASSSSSSAAAADKSQLLVVSEVWAVSSLFRAESQTYLSQQLERWLDDEEVKLDSLAAAASVAAAAASSSTAPPVAALSKKSSKAVIESDEEDDEPVKKKGGAPAAKDKKKGGKKGAAEEEEEEVASKSKDKKSSGKRRKKGDVSSDDDEPSAPAAAAVAAAAKPKGKIKLPSSAAASTFAPLTRDRVQKWLKAGWGAVVRNAQKGNAEVLAADALSDESTDELLQALAAMILPALLTTHKARAAARAAALAAVAGAFSSSSSSSGVAVGLGPGSESLLRRQQLECFRFHVQEQWEQILLYQHAIEYLGGTTTGEEKGSVAAAAPSSLKVDRFLLGQLESHLSKTLCTALADLLLRMEVFSSLTIAQQNHLPGMDNLIVLAALPASPAAAAADEKDPGAKFAKFELNRSPLLFTDRVDALSTLTKRSSDPFHPLLESLTKEPAVFVDRFEVAARALDVPLKKLDKKSERSRVFALRKSLMASLATEQKPTVVLHLTVLLLFAKIHSVVPHAPAKSIPTIRRLLRPDVLPAAYSKLRRYNQLVVRSLRMDLDDEANSDAAASSSSSSAALVSESEDESADSDLPPEQQVRHMKAAAVALELQAGLEAIRGFGMDASTAVRDTKGK